MGGDPPGCPVWGGVAPFQVPGWSALVARLARVVPRCRIARAELCGYKRGRPRFPGSSARAFLVPGRAGLGFSARGAPATPVTMSDPQVPGGEGADDLLLEEEEEVIVDDVPVSATAAECFLASSSEEEDDRVTVCVAPEGAPGGLSSVCSGTTAPSGGGQPRVAAASAPTPPAARMAPVAGAGAALPQDGVAGVSDGRGGTPAGTAGQDGAGARPVDVSAAAGSGSTRAALVVPTSGPGGGDALPAVPRTLGGQEVSTPMAVDSGSYSGRVPALLLPPRPRAPPAPARLPVGHPPAPSILPGPARVAPLGGCVAVAAGQPALSMSDLVARVRGLTVQEAMESDGRMRVDFHLPHPRGESSRRVKVDPSWERELMRLVNQPNAVRVEHHWILSQPDDRHAQLWRTRVGRGEVYLDPAFGVCDLIAPALPREVDYPASDRGIASAAAPVAFGETVGDTGRYPDFDYYSGVPPYLSLTAPYPPMAGLKSASSWRRNHGVMADAFRTDITCALQTGNGRAPVYTPVRPPLWQEGWEPAPAFRFDTGSCLRYFGSVLASRPVHPLQGTFTLEVTLGQAFSFLLSVRRQGRLFHLPTGVRRHIAQLGVDLIAAKTGLAWEFEALLAVHDAVNWAGVLALPPYRDPQAGATPLPRH